MLIEPEIMCKKNRCVESGKVFSGREREELPDGDFRGAGSVWRGGQTNLETDAYAGNLLDKCFCDKKRK